MRIAVFGAGGMGGFFGGVLARSAEDVTLIARGTHLEAIRANGLTVKSQLLGDFTVPVRATDDPREVGPVDLILFCVKTYDLEAAVEQARPLLGENTVLIPVQNGIEVPDQLARLLGEKHVLGGLTYVGGSIEAPGVVAQRGKSGEIIFGELQGGKSPRTERVLSTLRQAGLDATLEADIRIFGFYHLFFDRRHIEGFYLVYPDLLLLRRFLCESLVRIQRFHSEALFDIRCQLLGLFFCTDLERFYLVDGKLFFLHGFDGSFFRRDLQGLDLASGLLGYYFNRLRRFEA